ncbi:MAG: Hsp33 family molecular chaperone HslO, partial [Clostridia bacterium]|nr:Hsp33 family molecular chaperone HslO [Clostridia bacterium]
GTGNCVFAGVVALQPLPFTSEEVLEKTWALPLQELLCLAREKGIEKTVEESFEADKAVWELRTAIYRCNCSREYLSGVLVSLGEEELRALIQEQGSAKIHCHYCNTDYEFTDEDADKLFSN